MVSVDQAHHFFFCRFFVATGVVNLDLEGDLRLYVIHLFAVYCYDSKLFDNHQELNEAGLLGRFFLLPMHRTRVTHAGKLPPLLFVSSLRNSSTGALCAWNMKRSYF